jgi:hypothetical protein
MSLLPHSQPTRSYPFLALISSTHESDGSNDNNGNKQWVSLEPARYHSGGRYIITGVTDGNFNDNFLPRFSKLEGDEASTIHLSQSPCHNTYHPA